MSEFVFEQPADLCFGSVRVRLSSVHPGDPSMGYVPAYNFWILDPLGTLEMGRISLRVGDTDHVRLYAGHIGYGVHERFRGHHYAAQACLALQPFVGRYYDEAIITCNPDNYASMRTIERIGARYLETVAIPPGDPLYQRGERQKRRYAWSVR